MRNLLFLAILFLAPAAAMTQIIIGQQGQLNTLDEYFKAANGSPSPTLDLTKVDSTQLKKWDSTNKRQLRDFLANNIQATITTLSQPPTQDLIKFYNWLMVPADTACKTEICKLIADLADINKKIIANGPYTRKACGAFQVPEVSKALDTTIENILNQQNFRLAGSSNRLEVDLDIYQANAIKSFWIKYFNTTLNDTSNAAIGKTDPSTLFTWSQELKDTFASVRKALAKVRAAITVENVLNAYRAHQTFKTFANTYQAVKLLARPWFMQWIWVSKGKMRFNPFDFTSDDWFKNNPQFDPVKSAEFNIYIDTQINRMIRYDTTGNVQKFKSLLQYQGAGMTQFSFQQQQDSLKKINDSLINDIQNAETYSNQIKFPIQKSDSDTYLFFSGDSKFSSLQKINQNRVPPMGIYGRVIATIYNIPQGQSTVLRLAKLDSIKDASSLQTQFDVALTSAAKLTSALSGFLPAIASFSPSVTRSAKNAHNLLVPTASPATKAFWKALATDLSNSNRICDLLTHYYPAIIWPAPPCPYLFKDDPMVILMKQHTGTVNQALAHHPASRHLLWDSFEREYIDLYIQGPLSESIQGDLISDSLYLAQLLSIYGKASLPPQKLSVAKSTTPVLHTEFQVTDPVEKAANVSYDLLEKSAKDSGSLSRISFRTGFHYRIQASAGIVYTCAPVVLTTVTPNGNGQATAITTTDQRLQAYAGLHFYPFGKGLFLQDPSFFGSQKYGYLNRLSIFAAISIPQPLNNFYGGLSYDLGPGFRISTGVNLYKYTKYQLVNGLIVNQSTIYKAAAPFVAIGIDPVSLVNALNIFK